MGEIIKKGPKRKRKIITVNVPAKLFIQYDLLSFARQCPRIKSKTIKSARREKKIYINFILELVDSGSSRDIGFDSGYLPVR